MIWVVPLFAAPLAFCLIVLHQMADLMTRIAGLSTPEKTGETS